jgi:phosphatidylglycerol:prolipoprotein diacylglycerol transferase
MRIPVEMVRERDITPDISAHITGSINYIQVHPTFLYESLWNVGVLLVMLYFARRKRFNGAIALIYFGGYGLGRAWIEAIRTDQLYLIGTHIPVSEVLGLLMFVLSVAAAILAQRQVKQGKRECIDYAAVKPFEKPAEETAAKTEPADKPESRPAEAEESAGTAKEDQPENMAEEKTAGGEDSQIPAAEAKETGASDELKDEAARAAAEFLQQSGDGSLKNSGSNAEDNADS